MKKRVLAGAGAVIAAAAISTTTFGLSSTGRQALCQSIARQETVIAGRLDSPKLSSSQRNALREWGRSIQ